MVFAAPLRGIGSKAPTTTSLRRKSCQHEKLSRQSQKERTSTSKSATFRHCPTRIQAQVSTPISSLTRQVSPPPLLQVNGRLSFQMRVSYSLWLRLTEASRVKRSWDLWMGSMRKVRACEGTEADGGSTGDWTDWKKTAPTTDAAWPCLGWEMNSENTNIIVWIDGVAKPELSASTKKAYWAM